MKLSAQERIGLIKCVNENKLSVSQACLNFGVSRKTYYKWHKRYQSAAFAKHSALKDRKWKLSRHGKRVSEQVEKQVLAILAKNPGLGYGSIRKQLMLRGGPTLSRHAIVNIIQRLGVKTAVSRIKSLKATSEISFDTKFQPTPTDLSRFVKFKSGQFAANLSLYSQQILFKGFVFSGLTLKGYKENNKPRLMHPLDFSPIEANNSRKLNLTRLETAIVRLKEFIDNSQVPKTHPAYMLLSARTRVCSGFMALLIILAGAYGAWRFNNPITSSVFPSVKEVSVLTSYTKPLSTRLEQMVLGVKTEINTVSENGEGVIGNADKQLHKDNQAGSNPEDVSVSPQADAEENKYSLTIKSNRSDYPAGESPVITVTSQYKQIEKISNSVSKVLGMETTGLEERITPKLVKADGQTIDAVRIRRSDFRQVEFFIDKAKLIPGKYTLTVADSQGETVTQDFTWGVLALNYDKSVYTQGETANFGFAVLDEMGMIVCNADLKLDIVNPHDNKTISLTSEEKQIVTNTDVCGMKFPTTKPDYSTSFTFEVTGEYNLVLTARTERGTYTVSDSVSVRANVAYDIQRDSATRIYPLNIYPVYINITPYSDFKGEIKEVVPSVFAISQLANEREESTPSVDISNLNYSQITKEGDINVISWKADLKKGVTYRLGYQYDAPDESPQFYLLGPLKIVEEGNKTEFSEERQWQVAVDANYGYSSIGGSTSAISADTKRFTKFTSPSDIAEVDSIYAYYDRASSGSGYAIRGGIYTDNSGQPGSLVTNSSIVISTNISRNSPNWYTVSYSTKPVLSPNTVYWIGIQAAKASVTYFTAGTTNQTYTTSDTYADDLSSSWGTLGTGTDEQYSIYVTYTPVYPTLTQSRYRWRNDDNNEASATWKENENTSASLSKTIPVANRLRLEVSNEGTGVSGSITYRLEYGVKSTDCVSIGTWTPVPVSATSEHFQMATSSFVTDATATTDVANGLTNDNTSFVAGQVKTTGNTTSGIALTTTEFTEVEYSIAPTSNATVGGNYCFRVTNAGSTTYFDHSVYAEASVKNTLDIGGTLKQTNETDAVTDANGTTVQIKVEGSGTYSTTINGSGVYTKSVDRPSAGESILVYVDDNSTYKASGVTISDGTNNITMDLYDDRLVAKSDNGSNAIAVSDFTDVDTADADDLYSYPSAIFTVNTGIELHVNGSDIFTPGARVDTAGALGDLHLGASADVTLNTSGNVISGDVKLESGANLTMANDTSINGGDIVTVGASVFDYSGTPTVTVSGGGTIGGGSASISFANLIVTGSGSTTQLGANGANTVLVAGDVTVEDGHTLDLDGKTLDVNGGDVRTIGGGTIACAVCSSGGLTISGNGTTYGIGGGTGAVTLYNLTLDGATNTTNAGSEIIVKNSLAIGSGRTLAMGTNNLTVGNVDVSESGDASITGSLTQDSTASVLILSSQNGTALWTSGDSSTFSVGNLTVGNGITTINASLSGIALGIQYIVKGTFTNQSNTTFTAPPGPSRIHVYGNYDNYGSFIHNNGTVLLYSNTGAKTIRAGGSSFYLLYFISTDAWSFIDSNITVEGSFVIQSGSVTLPSGNLYVGQNFSVDVNFIHNGGTVVLNGDAGITQNVMGADTTVSFNNLTVTGGNRIVTFKNGTTYTISGNLYLTGTDCNNLLILRSEFFNSQYTITHNTGGTNTFDYLDIQDSNWTNALNLDGTKHISDSSGNSNLTSAANTCVGASTTASATATTNSFQRKTFFDDVNLRYWTFFHDGDQIEVRYSANASTWTTATKLAYDTNDFSVWYKAIGTYEYVFLAVASSDDIVVRRGSLDGSSVTWDETSSVALDGAASTPYAYPYISIDTSNYLWVGARSTSDSTYSYKTASLQDGTSSSDTADTALSGWDWTQSPYEISATDADSNLYGNIVPLSNGEMYATFVRGTALEGCKWVDGATNAWQNASSASCTTTVGGGGNEPTDAWYSDSNWIYRNKIIVDKEMVAGTSDISDFPILINNTITELRDTANGGKVGKSDGTDILFTNQSGTKLSHEIEKYNNTTGELVAWVEVSTLYAQQDTVLYMYYGYADATDQRDNTGGTWSNGFKAVYHLKETTINGTSGEIKDSSPNAVHMTGMYITSVYPSSTNSGKVGNAVDFPADGYLKHTLGTSWSGNMTISAWLQTDVNDPSVDAFRGYFTNADAAVAGSIQLDIAGTEFPNHYRSILYDSTNRKLDAGSADSSWRYVVTKWDGTNTVVLNNNSTITDSSAYVFNPTFTVYKIGTNRGADKSWNGRVDELRISSTPRSSEWLTTEYNNMSDPGSFYEIENITVKIDDASDLGALPGTGRQLVRTKAGGLYAFVNDGGNCEMWKSLDGAGWTQLQSATAITCDSGDPVAAAIDSNQKIHTTYIVGSNVRYRVFDTTASPENWDGTIGEETVHTSTGSVPPSAVDLAVDAQSIPHLVYYSTIYWFNEDYNRLLYRNRSGGSWSSEAVVASFNSSLAYPTYRSPTVTINANDVPEVYYLDDESETSAALIARVGDANNPTIFSTYTLDSSATSDSRGITVAVNPITGVTSVVYKDYGGSISIANHVGDHTDSQWNGTYWLTDATKTGIGNAPSVAIAGTGEVYAFYHDNSAASRIMYDTYDVSRSAWTGETVVQTPLLGDYLNIKAKWSFEGNNYGTNRIDYLFSDGMDVYFSYLELRRMPTSIDDASDFQALPGSGNQVLRTNSGTLYTILNDGGNCEVWKSLDNGNSWSQKDSLTAVTCDMGDQISAAIDSSNTIHVVYLSGTSVMYRTFVSDAWTSEVNVHTFTTAADYASITLDSSDVAHLVIVGDVSGNDELRYKNRVGGSWTRSVEVISAASGNTFITPSITINNNNRPQIAVIFDNVTYDDLRAYVGNDTDATGFTPKTVDNSVNVTSGIGGASIAVDTSGNSWIGYVDSDSYINLYKHSSGTAWDSGSWTEYTNPANNVGKEPSLMLAGNNVYILYQDDRDDIVYDSYGSAWGGETLIEIHGVLQDVKAKWSYLNNYDSSGTHNGDAQIDYLYSDGTDVYYNRITFETSTVPGSQDSIDTLILSNVTKGLSAVTDGSGNIHLVYMKNDPTTDYIAYKKRTDSTWDTNPTSLDASNTNGSVSLALNSSNSNLYAFYIDSTTNFIYHRQYTTGWGGETSWRTEGTYAGVTANYSGSGRIFGTYTTGAATPFAAGWTAVLTGASNSAPSAPTTLYANNTSAQSGQVSPVTGLIDHTPAFSAIFNDTDTSDTAGSYQLQIGSDSDWTSAETWDSGKQSVTGTCNEGDRCGDIVYSGGTGLSDGSTYYWRIKYWDNYDSEGTWSSSAQFTMNNSPVVTGVSVNGGDPIDLNADTTTPVSFTATISDNDGESNIDRNAATGKLYRSGVTEAQNCAPDNNNCYEVASCTVSNCAGTSCSVTCSINMTFYADATNAGPYISEYWRGWIEASDNNNEVTENFSTAGSPDVNSLLSISATSTIGYGSLEPGGNTSNKETTVINRGNRPININVSGDDMCTDYPTCLGSKLIVGNQEYSADNFSFGNGTILTSSPVTLTINIPKSTAVPSNASDFVYWGVGVPSNKPSGGYTGQNYVTGVAAD